VESIKIVPTLFPLNPKPPPTHNQYPPKMPTHNHP
jgi:hypothetical protein